MESRNRIGILDKNITFIQNTIDLNLIEFCFGFEKKSKNINFSYSTEIHWNKKNFTSSFKNIYPKEEGRK